MSEKKETSSNINRTEDALWKRRWAKLRRNKAALFGGALLLIYIFMAVFAPVIYPGNPNKPKLIKALEKPSAKDLLGTDELGRPILGRIIHGSRTSLTIALFVVLVGLVVGVPLGLISGYYGGMIDFVLQRITDIMLAFPGFLLALALVSFLGVGLKNTVISIGISMVPIYIRLVRGCVLSVREQVYVEAARAVGTRDMIILGRHVLPNVMVPIIVQTTLGMGLAILFAAGLGFLRDRCPAASARMGRNAGIGTGLHFPRPACGDLPGNRDLSRGAGFQPVRRRAQRRPGSEIEAVRT